MYLMLLLLCEYIMLTYCYKMLLLHDKKIHLNSNVIIACADMLDIVRFILTSRTVCCLYLYEFLSSSTVEIEDPSNIAGPVADFFKILSEHL